MAVAELFWDDVKSKRKTTGSLPKVQQPFSSKSVDDLFASLNEPVEEESDSFVYVVVHNIDGPGLRDSETQQHLARMASCSHVRMIASVDHVNAPLCRDSCASLIFRFGTSIDALFPFASYF